MTSFPLPGSPFDLKGKTAIVTGAASGIGLGVARAFARAGMRLVLADVQERALQDALMQIHGLGAEAISVVADVSDAQSVASIGAAAEEAFGKLHVAVNNAGVALHGSRLEDVTLDEWRWAVDVNIFSIIHGVRAFMPLIRRHGEGGHVVNTASGSGLFIRRGRYQGAYAMTKYAVVALSEALEAEAAEDGIGVSVLCPGAVQSKLHESSHHRPERYGGDFNRPEQEFMGDLIAGGLPADTVGEAVAAAVRSRQFYILTHASLRAPIQDRHDRIMASIPTGDIGATVE